MAAAAPTPQRVVQNPSPWVAWPMLARNLDHIGCLVLAPFGCLLWALGYLLIAVAIPFLFRLVTGGCLGC